MIRTDSLTRTYGDFTAVDRVSFQIQPGEIVGLLGHNGAGKTTIMKMLTGYLEPSAGSVQIDDLEVTDHLREVQQKIGYLPENCPVYPEMTVIDYLEFAAGLHGIEEAGTKTAVRQAIERVDLATKADQFIATLSRGYRQRVGVAQSILHNPRILILDEPTNGLDPAQIHHMRELVREVARTSTVILSTHILQEVQAVCDRVLILRDGKLAVDSRLDELQTAGRLLVATDGNRDAAVGLLSGLDSVREVDYLHEEKGRHHFALQAEGALQSDELAPRVARTLMEGGFNLYALHPEHRDLETVFREINMPQEDPANG